MSDAKPEPGASKPCGCGSRGPLPKVTFSTFILSLASTALVHMGEAPDPSNGQTSEDPEGAKHVIDTLAMLKDKTLRCLDPDEVRLLEGLLYDLRMKFVVKTK